MTTPIGPHVTHLPDRLAGIARQIAEEINEDMDSGTVPSDVGGFGALHDHVDANVYGGLCDENSDVWDEDLRAVQDAVDAWLRAREPGGINVTP